MALGISCHESDHLHGSISSLSFRSKVTDLIRNLIAYDGVSFMASGRFQVVFSLIWSRVVFIWHLNENDLLHFAPLRNLEKLMFSSVTITLGPACFAYCRMREEKGIKIVLCIIGPMLNFEENTGYYLEQRPIFGIFYQCLLHAICQALVRIRRLAPSST